MGMFSEETMKQVQTEGIEVDSTPEEQPKKDVVSESSTDASPDKAVDKTVSDGGTAKPTSEKQEENIPFHRHPRFKQLTEENQKFKSEVAELRRLYEESRKPQSNGPSMSDEDRAQLRRLAQMFKSDPEVSKDLGLDKIQLYEQKLQQLEMREQQASFDSELDSTSKAFAEQFGMTKEDVEEEIVNFIQNSEYFGNLTPRKGMVREVAKALYFDKLSALKEKEVNLKLIKEQKEKKSNSTESPSKGAASKAGKVESSMSDYLNRRLREEGGEIAFD